jgi:hypothetical protein
MGLMLATVYQAGGEEICAPPVAEAPPVPVAAVPVANAYTMPYQRGCSLKRICQWLFYRPLPVPAACQCPRCQTIHPAPLYMYFIGEFGPRSPELAHLTGGFAAGQVFVGPNLFGPPTAGNGHISAPIESHSDIERNTISGPPPRLMPRRRTAPPLETSSKGQEVQQVPAQEIAAPHVSKGVVLVRVPVAPVRQEAPPPRALQQD